MTGQELRDAIEKAFDYRGDVTITRQDGSKIEGYVFDRTFGKSLRDSAVRLFPKDRAEKLAIPFTDIMGVEFTGRDTAEGKSWEAWMRQYHAKRAAGEKTDLEPEALD